MVVVVEMRTSSRQVSQVSRRSQEMVLRAALSDTIAICTNRSRYARCVHEQKLIFLAFIAVSVLCWSTVTPLRSQD